MEAIRDSVAGLTITGDSKDGQRVVLAVIEPYVIDDNDTLGEAVLGEGRQGLSMSEGRVNGPCMVHLRMLNWDR
jgi:hypothetical protein